MVDASASDVVGDLRLLFTEVFIAIDSIFARFELPSMYPKLLFLLLFSGLWLASCVSTNQDSSASLDFSGPSDPDFAVLDSSVTLTCTYQSPDPNSLLGIKYQDFPIVKVTFPKGKYIRIRNTKQEPHMLLFRGYAQLSFNDGIVTSKTPAIAEMRISEKNYAAGKRTASKINFRGIVSPEFKRKVLPDKETTSLIGLVAPKVDEKINQGIDKLGITKINESITKAHESLVPPPPPVGGYTVNFQGCRNCHWKGRPVYSDHPTGVGVSFISAGNF